MAKEKSAKSNDTSANLGFEAKLSLAMADTKRLQAARPLTNSKEP